LTGDREDKARAKAKTLSQDELQSYVPSLRDESRRTYLKMRSEREIELLAKEIEDEETMFAGRRMTKEETRSLEKYKSLVFLFFIDKFFIFL
jgi:hypothetical protein